MKTGLVTDPIYKEHDPGPGHPERIERCDAVLAGIRTAVAEDALVEIEPRVATEDEIVLCHTRGYVRTARDDIGSGRAFLSTGDTNVSAKSWDAAVMAAGGVIAAVDAVMDQKVANAFCAVRPPGHHATRDRGMGFCVFNNVAIGARYAQKKHKLDKVLIVDWDVHHGNGTQDIFYDDPTVFYFSTHQWPFYPGTGQASETGQGKGKGTTLNCPFAAGSGRHELVGAFKEKLIPAMKDFKPDLVMISAGFDGRRGDLIGQLTLDDGDFEEMTGLVMNIASNHAKGRVVSALEGGYHLGGLASAAGAHVKRLTQPEK